MADKWEELFRTLAENTHSITQILDETNEGDELDEKYKEIEAARDAVVKAAKEAPSDIPDFYDDGAQLELSNAANIPVTACDKLVTALNEKTDIWKEKQDLGKIVKEVVHTNSEALNKPYPAANPNAPKITGQMKKAEAESNRLAKAHAKPADS
ncbi:hypothetical protein CLAFUW4_12360 [Fulvia fulva]|uniref:Uncharacterized protein n=1 Tax=Passalora fulva TaxID=5499 RepID=A0A9Q8USM2_PASFU|nr:uncharacterized protein CLAFUR5_11389 [Fulvia fulva]KAK4618135.1 hypothetical protein CLAFUR4_12365 [Fulvia fulva]KAK4618802.1 hypothetical protein CLAFUR0_12376 [Fulvia fulva]UJO20948.1 hypothetical protein CLAFUR5_11389 [Fulvia fulva]WPV17874.1 hypothetical protein CLAFUW4_12360 [Fulvia fulva]WPV33589.1 hypothetical protein CLAFUW7_12367 [Fulvia fulva]